MVKDVDGKGKATDIGTVEVSLADVVLKANRTGLSMPIIGRSQGLGDLILFCDEKTKTSNRVELEI